MRIRLLAPALIATATLVAGCASAPTEAVNKANAALDAAQQAQAPDYAPEAWTTAQDSQAKLQAELAAQEKKFALFRSYDEAKNLAAATESAAENAKSEAVAGKERTKEEAQTLMTQAQERHDEVVKALESAPKGKGTEADLVSLKADSGSIETTLQEMQSAFDAGDYLTAKTKAEAAIASSQDILDQIQKAREMRGRTSRGA